MKKNNEEKIIKYLQSLILRTMSIIVIFLVLAILSKSSKTYKDMIINNLYEKNISFTSIKRLYDKYLGGIVPLDKKITKELSVFSESLTYHDVSIYHDGAKLTVDNNYLVPATDEGMVIFIGEKENYNNVIIIENQEGIDTWYGNIDKIAVKLYDYIDKGTYLGTVKDNTLYLAYKKDGEFLNYKDYLK